MLVPFLLKMSLCILVVLKFLKYYYVVLLSSFHQINFLFGYLSLLFWLEFLCKKEIPLNARNLNSFEIFFNSFELRNCEPETLFPRESSVAFKCRISEICQTGNWRSGG